MLSDQPNPEDGLPHTHQPLHLPGYHSQGLQASANRLMRRSGCGCSGLASPGAQQLLPGSLLWPLVTDDLQKCLKGVTTVLLEREIACTQVPARSHRALINEDLPQHPGKLCAVLRAKTGRLSSCHQRHDASHVAIPRHRLAGPGGVSALSGLGCGLLFAPLTP